MAQAAHSLCASNPARNPTTPTHETAALRNELSAALVIWAALPPDSPREVKVCRQLLELRARLGSTADAGREGVHHA